MGMLQWTAAPVTVCLLFAGDLGYLREDGLVAIEDRLKELIKYKGFQVWQELFFFFICLGIFPRIWWTCSFDDDS